MNKEELININGIREDLYQAMQIGDITLSSKNSQKLVDFMNYQDKEIRQLKKQFEVGEEQYNDLVEEKEKLQEQLSSNTLQLEKLNKQVNKGLYNVCLPYKTGYDKAIKDKEIQQKEFIEYLENIINDYENTKNQLQQKDNIIKEVREYANNIMFETKAEEKIQDDILEILDKENKQ